METLRYKEKKQMINSYLLATGLKMGGIPVKWFKRGNGVKTVLSKVGRLKDFSGVYVIKDDRFQRTIIRSSKKVLNDILCLIRGYRKSDEKILKTIANDYGYVSNLAGLTFLKEMKVMWIEENDERSRDMLVQLTKINL